MTTDTELRDLLATEAGGTTGGRGDWDDVIRRGRHRQRVRRAQGASLAALAVGVVVSVIALSSDDPSVETIPPATDPTSTTVAEAPSGTTSPELPYAFRVQAFRAQGVFLTVAMLWDGPLGGFDPCTDLLPVVVEATDEISIELISAEVDAGRPWADCGTGHMGSWGTIELAGPVGTRTVNGRVVIDGASLLLPDELPAPFDLERREEAATRHSVTGDDGLLEGVWSWSFSWRAGASDLRLTVGEPATSDECEGEREQIEVRGTMARLCREPLAAGGGVSYSLEWEEDGRPVRIGYQSIDPAPLTLDDLRAIAEGLEPLGG
jgi:hypothetical protein